VKYGEAGFDADDLLAHLELLPPSPVLYGSGFEQQTELLEKISGRHQLIGNNPEIVARLKSPHSFFDLLGALQIPYPATQLTLPDDKTGWLIKRGGGSGGTHIRRGGVAASGEYYQQEIAGEPVSVLFLADGKSARIVGFNQQWVAPESGLPFCYGGAVSRASVPPEAKTGMNLALQAIVGHTGLRGINSMDCMLIGNRFFVLEINPRLSASFGLYDGPWLLREHLQACAGHLWLGDVPDFPAQAHKIIFAPAEFVVPRTMPWPTWVADIPEAGSIIKAGQPVCSVLASAADAASARKTVFARGQQLEAQLHPLFLNGIHHEPHTT
jgi:predicted ATP-grasp superfamily ATP-dependent carboligase